jgi:hypothetical protein
MTRYAWHARGSDWANKVKEEAWVLFGERLASARAILEQSKSMKPCPGWWTVRLRVARGQGEEPADFESLFREAKNAEPKYVFHDQARAVYLLPRWHGEPGEWEAAAEKEIENSDGLGHEGYARVIWHLADY